MLAFYVLSAAMVAIALAFLLLPLLRPASGPSASNTSSGMRAKLALLKQMHADGLLDESEFQRRRGELSEALLATLDTPALAPSPNKLTLVVAVGLLVLLPVLVMGLYRTVGTPQGLSFGPSARVATAAAAAVAQDASSDPAGPAASTELSEAAKGLKARLESAPEDGQGWMLLGRTYLQLQDWKSARDAYREAVKRLPPDAEMLAQYAEALGLADRPKAPPPEAEVQVDAALKLDPLNQRALWLKGIFRRIAGDVPGALKVWESLLSQLPAGEAVTGGLIEQINPLRIELGQAPLPMPQTQPASEATAAATPPAAVQPLPAAAAPDSAKGEDGISVQIDISPALKAQLSPNDVLFVFAKAEAGPPMPLAIQRLAATSLPLTVQLDDSTAMMPNLKLSMFPRVIVGARVSKSGVATAQAGDFQVLSAALDQPFAGPLQLVIADVVK